MVNNSSSQWLAMIQLPIELREPILVLKFVACKKKMTQEYQEGLQQTTWRY